MECRPRLGEVAGTSGVNVLFRAAAQGIGAFRGDRVSCSARAPSLGYEKGVLDSKGGVGGRRCAIVSARMGFPAGRVDASPIFGLRA